MRVALVLAVALLGGPASAAASGIDKMLAKLGPEERSHQVCALKGMDAVRTDARLRQADRLKSSVFSPAALEQTRLTAKGGAVRSGNHWYALSYVCTLTGDLMKATSFSFQIGPEIPERNWDRYGLWR
jgi:hypothetical protein